MKNLQKKINKSLEQEMDQFKNSFINKIANAMQYNQEKDIFEVKLEELEKFKPKKKEKKIYSPAIRDIIFFLIGVMFMYAYIVLSKMGGFPLF